MKIYVLDTCALLNFLRNNLGRESFTKIIAIIEDYDSVFACNEEILREYARNLEKDKFPDRNISSILINIIKHKISEWVGCVEHSFEFSDDGTIKKDDMPLFNTAKEAAIKNKCNIATILTTDCRLPSKAKDTHVVIYVEKLDCHPHG